MPPADPTSPPTGRSGRPLVVRPITAGEHREFLAADSPATRSAPVSFVQSPASERVEIAANWTTTSLGWFDGDTLVGAGRVVYRHIPKQRRFSLAYFPEGPVVDWADPDLDAWLDPMLAYLEDRHCFGVRIGPLTTTRVWDAPAVKAGLADDAVARFDDLPPTEEPAVGTAVVRTLQERGWRPLVVAEGFGAGLPQYNFVIPLLDDDGAPRTDDDLLAAMNQQWRRNIRKAASSGVEVTHLAPGGTPGDLAAQVAAFHRLYVETAERDGFPWEPLSYFQSLADAFGADDDVELRLWEVHHDGDHVAGAITMRFGPRVWYAYGASSTAKREVRASNAMQWAMLRYARDAGAAVYDLRGVTATLSDADSDVGMIRFKVGSGGDTIRFPGEWDLPLRPLLYKAFDALINR